MRRLIVIVCICFSSVLVAQKPTLTVEGVAPNLYINHKVAAGESLYGLARKYNQSPKAIASLNNIELEKGLLMGQVIKIPLTNQNFANKAEAGEKLTPLYHKVAKSETLFRIGNNYNVAPTDIKQWNRLPGDNIALGTPLIVGYLKTANAGALASTPAPKANNKTAVPAETNAANTPASTGSKSVEPVTEVKKPEEQSSNVAPAKSETVATPASTSSVAAPPVAQQIEQPRMEQKRIDLSSVDPSTATEGVFQVLYQESTEKSVTNKTGEAATFKSTSGWQDKKYYVLMNDVAPGTILKIASGDNKVVFAKVLGGMPQMKENKGLLLRISNAAASSLGIIDPKFPVQVSYYQ